MIILWSILSTVGLLVAMWYTTSIFNPYGRINYPMVLWKSTGHIICWILIIMGIISLIFLYISADDLILFLKILTGILVVVFIVKLKFTPLEMPLKMLWEVCIVGVDYDLAVFKRAISLKQQKL